jgi:biotin transport system ATP-binding protein
LTGGLPLFSIRNLSKVFPAGTAVSGLDLDIFSGECLVIAGSNGSGKTLLMKMIAGLVEPTGGEILFQGTPLEKEAGKLRAHLGLVFQDADAQIVGETVLEDAAFGPRNLGLNKAEAEDRAKRALEAMGLSGKEDHPPRRLSGGEKRRLAVAGVIAMGCDTVIMDEPFANLDWEGVVQTLEIIRSLKNSGKTPIILTHELEKVLALADRLVILHRGKIREDGRPVEILGRLKREYGVRNPLVNYGTVEDCSWLE